MELIDVPSPASESGGPEESVPQSGGRRRIVPFVAKRSEMARAVERAEAKEAKAVKASRPSTPPPAPSHVTEDVPQTLVPLPRRHAAPVPTPAKGAPLKKDAFIRSFPGDVRASEIQAAGAAKGLAITVGYVHWVRSRAKAAQVAETERAPRKKRTPTAPPAAPSKKPVVGAKSPPRAAAPTRPASAKPDSRARPLGGAADPQLASAITAAAIAAARMPNREASERLIITTTAQWVGFDRAIDLLRTAQGRVGLLLRP